MSELISWCDEHDCPSKECDGKPHIESEIIDPDFEDDGYYEDEDPYL